jgi:phage/plasmid primase-like uncharacterized protein
VAYKTFVEQQAAHITCLRTNGLDVHTLDYSGAFIRCKAIGQENGRGDLSYKSTIQRLENGTWGINTWYRGVKGKGSYSTYGLGPIDGIIPQFVDQDAELISQTNSKHEEAARAAYGFWNYSLTNGSSDYLQRKGVGYYGIRFRSSEQYGNVAVVPMRDKQGKLWSYQLLNPDGSKLYPPNAKTCGLFHALKPLANGKPIGLAESYVTAATCMELSDIPTACAFNCNNLAAVALSLHEQYQGSLFVVFADNDRHLRFKGHSNEGLSKAQQVKEVIGDRCLIIAPDFGELAPTKDLSDWNDLARARGRDEAKRQLLREIR